MKLLFINSDDDERDLYSIYLENTIPEVEITSTYDIERGISLLESEDFSVVICSNKVQNGTPGSIFNFIRNKNIKPIFILL